MTAWASWTAKTIMLTAGLAVAGGGLSTAASASPGGGPVTSGMGSVGGGNQVSVPVTAPVDVCGNAVAVLGIAGAGCEGGSLVQRPGPCGCQPGGDAFTSLLPVISRPRTSLTAYREPAAGHPAPVARMPRAALSAADGGGMSDTTFFTLAGGILLAGISALKMSSRRRPHRGAA